MSETRFISENNTTLIIRKHFNRTNFLKFLVHKLTAIFKHLRGDIKQTTSRIKIIYHHKWWDILFINFFLRILSKPQSVLLTLQLWAAQHIYSKTSTTLRTEKSSLTINKKRIEFSNIFLSIYKINETTLHTTLNYTHL